LLVELSELVGLTDDDIGVLRKDLDQMRPSERAGFIGEVIRQERARRAREIAEAKAVVEEGPPPEELARGLTEEEVEDLRARLLALGIAPDETEIMIEQAKSLTKAEVEALLEQLGGMGE
jgi:hypothetical protein